MTLARPRLLAALVLLCATAGLWLLLGPSPSPPVTQAGPALDAAVSPAESSTAPPGPSSAVRPPRADTGPTTQASPTPTPSPTARPHLHREDPEPGEPWRGVLEEFAVAFTDTHASQQAWHDRVSGLVSPHLAEQLSYTDPTRIPTGSPTGTEVLAAGAYAVQARIDYDTGLQLLVQVVAASTSDRWWVADVIPAGDQPSPLPG